MTEISRHPPRSCHQRRASASERSEGRRADHVDADHGLVADRGDAVRPARVERDAVAGGRSMRLVADLEQRRGPAGTGSPPRRGARAAVGRLSGPGPAPRPRSRTRRRARARAARSGTRRPPQTSVLAGSPRRTMPVDGALLGEQAERRRAERVGDVAQRVQRRVEQAALHLAQHRHADGGRGWRAAPASGPARDAGGGSPRRAGAAELPAAAAPDLVARSPREQAPSSGTMLITAAPELDASIARHMGDVLVTGAAGGSARRSSTPCWRAATGCSRSIGSRRSRATCASYVVDAGDPDAVGRGARRRGGRRLRAAPRRGHRRRGAARREDLHRPGGAAARHVPRVAGAQPRHRVDHAAGGAAAPAAQRRATARSC